MKECPKCGKNSIVYEDQSCVGGDKKYWSCTSCGEEMIMFSSEVLHKNQKQGEDKEEK